MQLYDWQRECLRAWEKNEYRGIVNVVTGAGKTVFAIAALASLERKYPNLQVKVVVPTIPLARQWKEILLHRAPSEEWRPGFFGGGVQDDPSRRVMIYIVNSARAALSGHIRRDLSLNRHVLLICDECHHYQSKENRKIFSFVDDMGERRPYYHCLGLSATPFGTKDDQVLQRALGHQIYRYDYNDAAAEGVISPFIVCEVSASFLPEELEKYVELTDLVQKCLGALLSIHKELKGLSRNEFLRKVQRLASEADMDPSDPAAAFLIATYRRKEVSNLAMARVFCALSIIRKLRDTDRVLLFCERIEQAQTMAGFLNRELGNCCSIYHSGMSKDARTRIMEAFRTSQIRLLVSCKCLDEGIDVPDANIAIVLSSSSVSRQRIQRLGRVIRRADNKDAACLYYIYVRESSDDAAYLAGLENNETFFLRYFSREQVFSDELYEYVASSLLQRARESGLPKEQLAEIRRCAQEGLARADALLPDAIQKKNQAAARDVHERNYWGVMRKIGRDYRMS